MGITAFQIGAFQFSGFQEFRVTGAGGRRIEPWLQRLLRARAKLRHVKEKEEPLPYEVEALIAELKAKFAPVPVVPKVSLVALAATAEAARLRAVRLRREAEAAAARVTAIVREFDRQKAIDAAMLAASQAEAARVYAEAISAQLDVATQAKRDEDERIAALTAARMEAQRLNDVDLAAMVASALEKQRRDERELARFAAFIEHVDDYLDAA